MANNKDELMQKIVALAKRRGFIFPGSDIYGGLANSWDYGPMGVELKKNLKDLWWERFVHKREDIVGVDTAIIMNPKVWQASGHTKTFNDPLVECAECHRRFRADTVEEGKNGQGHCPNCDGKLGEARNFNLMFKTNIGPTEDDASVAYLRPETAQGIFANFKNVLDSTRQQVPFGIAQIGKAFRNEITPGNFIFRTREFEQMEIEYFVKEGEWKEHFEHWRKELHRWLEDIGINMNKIHEFDAPVEELAHYSKKTIDFEFDFPFGRDELYGLAYRTDYDLSTHTKHSNEKLTYRDPQTNEEFTPHVIEPSLGVDRTILALLLSVYREEKQRTWLALPPRLAPYKAAVFPLLSNKEELVEKARGVFEDLQTQFPVAWDARGNIGKRYFAQDEIGTPYCITIDFDTLEDNTVTIRHRDIAEQERINIDDLAGWISEKVC